MRFNMNTHKLSRKWIYMTLLKKILSAPYGLLRMTVRRDDLAITKRGGLIIALLYLLPLCGFLTGCGLKLPPKPPEDAVITYPRPYPNPKLEEWSIAEECPPPVLEVCSSTEVSSPTEECSPDKVCGE